jgi:hypothetical protein
MAESIGNIYETAVPSLSDTADIQEALRLYHYGANSGSGDGQYPTTNTDPTNLVIPSVAYHLYDLQRQVTAFKSGILPEAYVQKGTLISASSPGNPLAITPTQNGQVLTADSSRATGLDWKFPEITLTNTITLSNKTLINASIGILGLKFNGPTGNAFITTLLIPEPTANKTVSLPGSSIIPGASTVLVGADTVQTLTNKSIAVGQLTGTLPITSGGTGAITAANARNNIEIFNTQTAVTAGNDRTTYSGKIYVADPGIVGATGANLDGAAQGDLWFW